MGNWRADQSKGVRRKVWGQTRGEGDATWKDVSARFQKYPVLANLRVEKIGSEIHVWRPLTEPSGEQYWASCLRFVDDGYGYWTVMYRTDERRWRSTPFKEISMGRIVEGLADFYQAHVGNDPSS